ncbi:hypothetical protein EZS27_029613, partial [termite gut metagenome]
LEPYSISGEQAVYHCPLFDGHKPTIAGIQLKALETPSISIGRAFSGETRDTINLKTDERGNLLFRTDAGGFRLINTIAELQLIAEGANDDNLKASYKQESDIDFMSQPVVWIPIGWNESFPFSGVYNGNGYKIRNMYVSKSLPLSNTEISPDLKEEEMIGFFGYNTGIISNLCLVSGGLSVDIISENMNRKEQYDYSIGTICGYNNGRIEYCSNSDYSLYLHIEPSEKTSNFYVGGISGKLENILYACINNSKIEIIDSGGEGDLRVGGLSGLCLNKGNNYGPRCLANTNHGELSVRTEEGIGKRTHGIGGLFGATYEKFIEELRESWYINNYNSGTITYTIGSQDYEYAVGGIIGILGEGSFQSLTYNYNIGEMRISYADRQTISNNKEYLGWMSGKIEKKQSDISIRDFYYDYDSTKIEKEELITVHRPIGNYTEENPYIIPEILKGIYRFSINDWPKWAIERWAWGDLGGWNNGNPVYPKLWIEKNK